MWIAKFIAKSADQVQTFLNFGFFEILIEPVFFLRYHQYQKERRELRKRNLQAQTNIAQYMRKHNIEQQVLIL